MLYLFLTKPRLQIDKEKSMLFLKIPEFKNTLMPT